MSLQVTIVADAKTPKIREEKIGDWERSGIAPFISLILPVPIFHLEVAHPQANSSTPL